VVGRKFDDRELGRRAVRFRRTADAGARDARLDEAGSSEALEPAARDVAVDAVVRGELVRRDGVLLAAYERKGRAQAGVADGG
jgi:hypothetical protein